ncbi:MAG: hypothetical protein IPK60_15745 [Sandaracinaceae bacterium]|nr:hypothetical protein [Sandaracinaceae bacterium]
MKIALFAVLLSFFASPGRVFAQIQGVDEWAEALVLGLTPHWAGQRVPHPVVVSRPAESGAYTSSTFESIRVHGLADSSEADLRDVLAIVEQSAIALRAEGWGVPAEDGGLGGSTEFDLYLADLGDQGYQINSDGTLLWPHLDSDSGFAIVERSLAGRDLVACVTAAYAESVMLGLDPAEAPAWRRATAAYLTYQLTGSFGCHEEEVLAGVARAYESAIPDVVRVAEGRDAAPAGYFIGLLDAQQRNGDGSFIRDMWQLTRQRTWEGSDLRGSPDLWMAIETTLGFNEHKLPEIIEQLSVARYLAGTTGAPTLGDRALPHVEPIWIGNVQFADLPEHFPVANPPIETYGQGFALVHTPNVPANTRLRVWMHGEFRVEWDLIVVPLDRNKHEITRIAAPPRRTPRSYLEVLLPANTDRVLIAVTNMSHRLPDADIPDENARSFELIVDR